MSCSRSRCSSRRERDARHGAGGRAYRARGDNEDVPVPNPDAATRMLHPGQSSFGDVFSPQGLTDGADNE